MKVIIAGCRDFTYYPFLFLTMNKYHKKTPITQVVCGESKGVDQMGKQWGLTHSCSVKSFPANWKKYGKSAGRFRNIQMARYAHALVAFWDGKSRGTKNMIEEMRKLGKAVKVVYTTGKIQDEEE